MKTKWILLVWAALALTACVVLSLRTIRQHGSLKEARASAHAQQAALAREHATLSQELATLNAELSRLTETLAPGNPASKSPPSARELLDRYTVASDSKRQRSPSEEEWHRNFYRRMVHMNDGELLERLPLQPAQLTRFKRLLAEKMTAASDASVLLVAQGQSSSSATVRKAIEQAKAEIDREIHALLGDENFAEYQEHTRTLRDQYRVREFNAALSEKNLPLLTPAQVRALASAACDVDDPARNPQHALVSTDSLGPIATDQILQRIPGILTSAQAQAFAAYRAEKSAARVASEKLVRGE